MGLGNGLCLYGWMSVCEENVNLFLIALAGIVLILAGQLVNGVQMIVEELFLKHRGFPPLQVDNEDDNIECTSC